MTATGRGHLIRHKRLMRPSYGMSLPAGIAQTVERRCSASVGPERRWPSRGRRPPGAPTNADQAFRDRRRGAGGDRRASARPCPEGQPPPKRRRSLEVEPPRPVRGSTAVAVRTYPWRRRSDADRRGSPRAPCHRSITSAFTPSTDTHRTRSSLTCHRSPRCTAGPLSAEVPEKIGPVSRERCGVKWSERRGSAAALPRGGGGSPASRVLRKETR